MGHRQLPNDVRPLNQRVVVELLGTDRQHM